MPIYTVRKADSEDKHEWDVTCSYKELEEMCEEYGLEKVIKPIGFISSTEGKTLRKAGTEWQNKLSQIHKNAGRNSKVKI
jgi:hypothetical protein